MTASTRDPLPSCTPSKLYANTPADDAIAADAATDGSSAPSPFQFRLRTLLAAMAAAGVVFAVLSTIGPIWSVVAIWAAMLVIAHVAGNACGTRRTGHSPGRSQPLLPTGPIRLNIRATRLRERHGPGLSTLVGVLIGAAAGGLLGTSLLGAVYWEEFGPGPVAVGGASSAVVGGFLGFLAASFMDVASRAWQEASYELRRRR